MNILISDVCNRKCEFCFADCATVVNSEQFMSIENVREVIHFLIRSKINAFRCIGGEPTLHPKFAEIMELVVASDLALLLFSNGVTSHSKVDYLLEHSDALRLGILCNATYCAKDTSGQIKQRDYFFSSLGRFIELSFTAHAPDFEYEYLLDIVDKYTMRKRIRVGVAHPIVGVDNVHLCASDFVEFKRTLDKFIRAATDRNVILTFDCGMPNCIGGRDLCKPIIDVGVDLSVWPCFPLRKMFNRKLREFEDYSHILSCYTNKFNKYKQIPLHGLCTECSVSERCSMGCIAHKVR